MKKFLYILAAIAFVGCSDSVVSPDTDLFKDRHATDEGSKLRNTEWVSTAGKGGKPDGGSSTATTTTELTDRVVVTLNDGIDAFALVERFNLTYNTGRRRVFNKTINGISVSTNGMSDAQKAAWMEDMNSDPAVRSYEPEGRLHQNSSDTRMMSDGRQWTPRRIKNLGGDKNSTASGDGSGSVDVDIYVIDSGIDHPDINVVERIDFTAVGADVSATELVERYALLQRFALLERFEWEKGTPRDAIGHGTHVAGTIAAIDDADHLVGVAPGARVHDFRVLDDNGDGDFGAVIEALEIIIARKQRSPQTPMIVNLSLGAFTGTTEFNALDEVVEAALQAGIVVVAAAGNTASDVSHVSPAHVPGVLTVGSALPGQGSSWEISAFSNTGRGIDLWAPGEDIESLAPGNLTEMNELTGTSMAAPHVTGAVALILAAEPNLQPHQVDVRLKQESNYKIHRAPKGVTDLVVDLGRL